METKICKICGEEKQLSEFYFRKEVNKYRYECKKCMLKKQKQFYEKNPEKLKKKREYLKIWKENNKEKKAESDKQYREKNKDKIKTYKQKYYIDNLEDIKQKQKKYNELNKEKKKIYKHQYYLKYKDEILLKNKTYRKNNKKKLAEYAKKYNYNKRHNNSLYKLKCQIRKNIWACFNKKGYIKNNNTEEILGCTLKYFYLYLLETYKKNYNEKWNEIEPVDIDHIIPLDTAKTEEDVIKLCHYTNLQLLKHLDNLKKSNNLSFELKN